MHVQWYFLYSLLISLFVFLILDDWYSVLAHNSPMMSDCAAGASSSRPRSASGTAKDDTSTNSTVVLSISSTESDSDTEKPSSSASGIASPWPYLDKFFQCKLKEGKTLKFACLLCKPRNVEISAYINSPSNLQKHVKVGKTKKCNKSRVP